MIEMPEAYTIAAQMNENLVGKTIEQFSLGNVTHKFLWLNRPDGEYEVLLQGTTIEGASSFGRSIYLNTTDYVLWWSDAGGKILYHQPGEGLPKKYHLVTHFTDGSALSYSLRMWGACKLVDCPASGTKPEEETGLPPLHPDFTFQRFDQMLEAYPEKTGKGIKGFLVATGYAIPDPINGLGNAIVQDILFKARLSPKRKIMDILPEERNHLFKAIQNTIQEAVDLGGRYDEFDLFGKRGGYIRLMDSKSAGTPCIRCGKDIQKISYLGGACYLCTNCQT